MHGNGIAVSCRISCCVALVKVNGNKESTRGDIIKVHMQIQLLRHKSVDSYTAELSVMANRWMRLGKILHKPSFRRINCLVSNPSHPHASHSSVLLVTKILSRIKGQWTEMAGEDGEGCYLPQ